MGTTFYSYAILGIRLSFRALHDYKKVKAFEHNYPESWKVCPESGRKLWTSYWLAKPFVIGGGSTDRIEGFKIIEGEYENYDEGHRWQYVAISSVQSHEKGAGRAPLDISPETLAHFQEVLTKVGVWDEKAFGLWAVMTFC